MTWLVEELRAMHVEDKVIATISECVRTVSCPGGCQEPCGVEYEQECCEGSSLQSAQGSTQDVEEATTFTYSAFRDECVRNVAYPGGCHGICRMEACMNTHVDSGIMKEDQGSTQDMQDSLSTKQNTQEFGVRGISIFWNNTLDEWVDLVVLETVF